MTLFIGTLFILVLSDFFVLNLNVFLLLYFIYLFVYFFYKNNNIIVLPNIFLLKSLYLNFLFFFRQFSYKFLNLLGVFAYSTLRWKPLFKRSSYFGIYRSTRNQWLNK